MPTVLRVGPYNFVFYGSDAGEPPHVHVKRDRQEAKFWIDPLIELENNHGFAPHELTIVRKLVEEHREFLLEKWHEFFNQ
jgi:hypothetical protein